MVEQKMLENADNNEKKIEKNELKMRPKQIFYET